MPEQATGRSAPESYVRQVILDGFVPPAFARLSWQRYAPEIRTEAQYVLGSLVTPNPRGLLLLGPTGVGKTGMLYLLLADYIEAVCRRAYEFTAPLERMLEDGSEEAWGNIIRDVKERAHYWFGDFDLLVDLLRRWRKEDDWRQMVDIKYRVFFIDELKADKNYTDGWNQSLIDQFVKWAYDYRVPLIITSNMTEVEIERTSGWFRIADRLLDAGWLSRCDFGQMKSFRREM